MTPTRFYSAPEAVKRLLDRPDAVWHCDSDDLPPDAFLVTCLDTDARRIAVYLRENPDWCGRLGLTPDEATAVSAFAARSGGYPDGPWDEAPAWVEWVCPLVALAVLVASMAALVVWGDVFDFYIGD